MRSENLKMKPVLLLLECVLVLINVHLLTAAKSDRVLLEDVKVLTLHQGQMTKAQRASPVPQLKCVGGSAGCMAFKPQVVQCYNRGSDGYDVQWECKTDMDNSYRFGKLQVSCEGYSFPDDPYILRGSCGLEYTLDLTEEGWEKKNSGGGAGHHQYYDNDNYHDRTGYSHYQNKAGSIVGDLMKLAIVAFIIYMVYKYCIRSAPGHGQPGSGDQPPSYDDTFRQQGPRPSAPPPPYGFRQEYTSNTGSGDSCSGGAYTSTPGADTHTNTNTGGGFWSGAFTGGILGYMFGNRGNNYYTHQRPHHTGWFGRRNHWGTGWGSGWGNSFGTGWGNSGWGNSGWGSGNTRTTTRSSGFSSAPRSSGTRTASGFGGTSRR